MEMCNVMTALALRFCVHEGVAGVGRVGRGVLSPRFHCRYGIGIPLPGFGYRMDAQITQYRTRTRFN